jgi:predicted phosphate transport protein (TIGR00153 family)
MDIKRFVQIVVGKDKKFFLQFESITTNVIDISNLLVDMLNATSGERRAELAAEINKLEDQGDKYTHELLNDLGKNFITPFDREDIHELVSAIDDVVDYIHGSAKRIILYKQNSISPAMQNLAGLILKGSKELNIAVLGLRTISKTKSINEACARIKTIEHHADLVFNTEVSKLFEESKDGVELIKVIEILQNLEEATDKCKYASKVIKSILMKNA